ncbi:MAG TPA: hypothetical protein VFK14_00120 [Solirubrobacterales bacterium]|nr:hypothetical protein [Solirubrobacterales bacterium]
MERDRDFEAQLLELASHRQIYRSQVVGRLDSFEADDGGNLDGWEAGLDTLLAEAQAEAQEEAADISGWLLGAARKLGREKMGRLIAAMRLANLAHEQLEELRIEVSLEAGQAATRDVGIGQKSDAA